MQQKDIQEITPPVFTQFGEVKNGNLFKVPEQAGKIFLRSDELGICLHTGQRFPFDQGRIVCIPTTANFTLTW